MFKPKKEFKKLVTRSMWCDPKRRPYDGTILTDLIERWEHRHEKIRVEFNQVKVRVGDREGYYFDRTDYWTEATRGELHSAGFLPGVRVPGYDSIQWWKQKVYVRLTGYTQFDIHQLDTNGNFIFPQDTPSTLHDEMISTATKDFVKAMFKTTLPTMDVQKIIMVAVLGVGLIFGLMMMGVI